MRKVLSLFLAISFLFIMILPGSATENENIIFYDQYTTKDGITVTCELIEHPQMRSNTKGYTYRRSFEKDNTVIGAIAIHGSFQYDGNTVSVVSKSVTQTNTYDGWKYKQNSFTSSGGTITLDAKLTKLLVMNIPFTMTLSCDKNGNISYT